VAGVTGRRWAGRGGKAGTWLGRERRGQEGKGLVWLYKRPVAEATQHWPLPACRAASLARLIAITLLLSGGGVASSGSVGNVTRHGGVVRKTGMQKAAAGDHGHGQRRAVWRRRRSARKATWFFAGVSGEDGGVSYFSLLYRLLRLPLQTPPACYRLRRRWRVLLPMNNGLSATPWRRQRGHGERRPPRDSAGGRRSGGISFFLFVTWAGYVCLLTAWAERRGGWRQTN